MIEIIQAGIDMLLNYLSEHVLTCLIPAFFIAGAIAAFVSKESVLKYFGVHAKKYISYSVASISGTILAVCSCTVLPLFAGIYKRGAGICPATAFLFSGPAINILTIVLTARILGFEIGLARAVAAVIMSIVIGLIMAAIFRKHDEETKNNSEFSVQNNVNERKRGISLAFFISLVAILIALRIVLNGGLQSCCSVYPPELVKEIVGEWTEGMCNLEVIDAKSEEWKADKIASLAIKYFSEYAYPFIYIDDVLITIGHFPSRGEFIAFLLYDEIKGISKDEIEELARNYGFTIDE